MSQAVSLRGLSVLHSYVSSTPPDTWTTLLSPVLGRPLTGTLSSCPDPMPSLHPMAPSPPPAYMPPLIPIKCLGLDCLGGDSAGTPVFMCHTIRPMTREQRACPHAFERFDVTVARCTGQPLCLLRALALSSVCVMTNSDALATGRLAVCPWPDQRPTPAWPQQGQVQGWARIQRAHQGYTLPPPHRHSALPPLREPVCRREGASAETANNGVGVTRSHC